MKKIVFKNTRAESAELVATFGQARLVRHASGQFELRGGRPEDRFEAREWASLFMHEAIIDEPSRIPRCV